MHIVVLLDILVYNLRMGHLHQGSEACKCPCSPILHTVVIPSPGRSWTAKRLPHKSARPNCRRLRTPTAVS